MSDVKTGGEDPKAVLDLQATIDRLDQRGLLVLLLLLGQQAYKLLEKEKAKPQGPVLKPEKPKLLLSKPIPLTSEV